MFTDASSQLLGRSQRILLELSTILYFIAKNSALPLIQQYVYFLVAKKYNITAHLNDLPEMERAAASDSASAEENEVLTLAHLVNAESSRIVLYLNIAELLPSAIVVMLFGFLSDVTGRRKFLMWLPCLGNAIYALGFLLPLYVCGGDIDHPATKALFFTASILSGLSGSVPSYLSGNASYISDTDTARRRTLRLAIVELSIGLTFGFANLANGFWIQATDNFEQPLWFVFCCSLLTFILLVFFLKEPNGELFGRLGHPSTWMANFKGVRHLFGLGTSAQKKLWAVFVAFQVYVFVQQGHERTFVLFLQNYPLFWNPVQIGAFIFVLYTLGGLCSWPGVPLLHRVTDDIVIAGIAVLSKTLGSLMLAFAAADPMVYISCMVQMFHLVPYAVARSLVSQQVTDEEQGSVYALLHSVQSAMAFLGPVVHNAIFAGSLHYMSGLVFLVSAPLLLIPLALIVITKRLQKLEEGYMSALDPNSMPKPQTPSSTPLSETSGFAQRQGMTFGSTTELLH